MLTCKALAPFLTEVVGLDISEGMLKEYAKNVQEAGLGDKMIAYQGDILAEPQSDELSKPELFDFDTVMVNMALHHLDDPAKALQRLAERLKKGGVCFIIDFVPDIDHHFHEEYAEAIKTIKTHGFEEDQTRKLFSDAGLDLNFEYQIIDEPLDLSKNGRTMQKTIFVAKGQRV